MQFATFKTSDMEADRAGVHINGVLYDLAQVSKYLGPDAPRSVLELLGAGSQVRRNIERALNEIATEPNAGLPLEQVTLRPPIPNPTNIFAVAGNYRSHIEEGGGSAPPKEKSVPRIFMKPANSLIASREAIRAPSIAADLDHELELCVVIGRRAARLTAEEASAYIGGYTIFNDISARRLNYSIELEPDERQWFFDWLIGKMCDTFSAAGPYLVTADEVAEPDNLGIELRVNGEVCQTGNTGEMIFSVPELVSFISNICTLEAGDMIATGTPAGTGWGRGAFLNEGDVLEGRIGDLGHLVNVVELESSETTDASARLSATG